MSPNAQEIGQIYAKGVLHAFVFTSISCEKICCNGQTVLRWEGQFAGAGSEYQHFNGNLGE